MKGDLALHAYCLLLDLEALHWCLAILVASQLQKLDLALPLYAETLKLMKAKLGPEHPNNLINLNSLGKAYCDSNQGEKAAAKFKEFVAGQRERSKPVES